ncbi:MAG: aminoacetone oxidase family FAD-binding enzyme [Eggerthellaceae bacterium]|nr:aminoacetone oxidase family FAD-binding enzyme [Eggerthellaceae bacterium]
MNTTCDIAIVGAGAAGLAAAISAAQAARKAEAQLRVVMLEASDRVGRSILKTGNGRCNFSNADIAEGPAVANYRNAGFVWAAFEALNRAFPEPDFNDPVLAFFEDAGLEWRQEDDGRRYPLSNKASTVLDVLRAEAARLGVEEVCDTRVAAIEAPVDPDKPFTLRLADGQFWRAAAVIVACGGAAVEHIELANMRPEAVQPILGPLAVASADQAFTRELDNIRVRCCVSLFRDEAGELIHKHTESGELLFRPYGVSGICVFNLSRLAQAGDYVQINFLQMGDLDHSHDYLKSRFAGLTEHLGQAPTYEQFMRGLVVPRLTDAVLKRAGCNAQDTADVEKLFQILCLCSLEVAGMGPTDVCQVQRGGYAPNQFDAATMQSRVQPGLYVAGEALDVDGPCGGYNLHWAWASGLLAGHAAQAYVNALSSSQTLSHVGTE